MMQIFIVNTLTFLLNQTCITTEIHNACEVEKSHKKAFTYRKVYILSPLRDWQYAIALTLIHRLTEPTTKPTSAISLNSSAHHKDSSVPIFEIKEVLQQP